MTRPVNWKSHQCIYCKKYPLHGNNRHSAPNETAGVTVTACKTCKNLRSKVGLGHEDFIRYMIGKTEKLAKRMRRDAESLAAEKNAYSLDFREEFGDAATKREVAALRAREPEKTSPLLKMLDDWDDDEDDDT